MARSWPTTPTPMQPSSPSSSACCPSRAPPPTAWSPAPSTRRRRPPERSASCGTGPRDRESAPALGDPERGLHAALAVMRQRAPQLVARAALEVDVEVGVRARLQRADPQLGTASDPLELQIVRVLARVDELDDHPARRDLGLGEDDLPFGS